MTLGPLIDLSPLYLATVLYGILAQGIGDGFGADGTCSGERGVPPGASSLQGFVDGFSAPSGDIPQLVDPDSPFVELSLLYIVGGKTKGNLLFRSFSPVKVSTEGTESIISRKLLFSFLYRARRLACCATVLLNFFQKNFSGIFYSLFIW